MVIDKEWNVSTSINDCHKFVWFKFGINFHSFNVCCCYSEVTRVFFNCEGVDFLGLWGAYLFILCYFFHLFIFLLSFFPFKPFKKNQISYFWCSFVRGYIFFTVQPHFPFHLFLFLSFAGWFGEKWNTNVALYMVYYFDKFEHNVIC